MKEPRGRPERGQAAGDPNVRPAVGLGRRGPGGWGRPGKGMSRPGVRDGLVFGWSLGTPSIFP